ncbi:hypothetical protein ACLOJK_011778 [Asimina triloba]
MNDRRIGIPLNISESLVESPVEIGAAAVLLSLLFFAIATAAAAAAVLHFPFSLLSASASTTPPTFAASDENRHGLALVHQPKAISPD